MEDTGICFGAGKKANAYILRNIKTIGIDGLF
jgi:hypothetical protein